MMKKTALVLCLTVGLLGSNALLASDDKQHFVGLFAGKLDTDIDTNANDIFGLEYEYKINSEWGVGAVYEIASEAHHGYGVTSKIGVAYYHPFAGLRVGLGFGKETVGSHTSHGHFVPSHSEDLIRVGVSYDFHVGGIGIEPSLNIDTVDGERALVYGVALVWSF